MLSYFIMFWKGSGVEVRYTFNACTLCQHRWVLLHTYSGSEILALFLKTHICAGCGQLPQWFLNSQHQHKGRQVCAAILINCLMKWPNGSVVVVFESPGLLWDFDICSCVITNLVQNGVELLVLKTLLNFRKLFRVC